MAKKLIFLLVLCLTSVSQAVIVTIESDVCEPYANFSYPLPDITLWRIDYYNLGVPSQWQKMLNGEGLYDDIYVAPSTVLAKPLGNNVIGNPIFQPAGIGEYWCENPYLLVEVDGLFEQIRVCTALKPGWTGGTFVVDCYAPDGTVVAHNFTNVGKALTTTLSEYEARYALIRSGVMFSVDNIRIDYEPIPESATIIILGLGILLCARKR
jgi:hypothetical protein